MNRKVFIVLVALAVFTACGGTTMFGLAYLIFTKVAKSEVVQNAGNQLAGMLELQSKLEGNYPSDSIEILVAGGSMLRIDMINSGILELNFPSL